MGSVTRVAPIGVVIGCARCADRAGDDAREGIRVGEQRHAAAEVDEPFDARFAGQELTQRPTVRRGHPLVRHDHAVAATRPHDPMHELHEVDVEIGDAVVAREPPECGLLRTQPLLAHVRRIRDTRVERRRARPVDRQGIADLQMCAQPRDRRTDELFDRRAGRVNGTRIDVGAEQAAFGDQPPRITSPELRGEHPHDLDQKRTFADRRVADPQREDLVGAAVRDQRP